MSPLYVYYRSDYYAMLHVYYRSAYDRKTIAIL